jgi:hypothetical protein
MRHFAIALGLCFSVGVLCSPLSAAQNKSAQGSAAHQTMLVKAKKNKSKFKPRKAPKRHARKANRAN